MHSVEGLSIGDLSQQTGVPVETLRMWERRYGVLSPTRSPGRHRRYPPTDVDRVRWLSERTAQGQRIGDAVAVLRMIEPAGRGHGPEALVEAAVAGDLTALEREVDRAFDGLQLVDALELVIFPALVELGDRWERDRETIAAEHLLSELTAARLGTTFAAARRRTGPAVLVYCPSGERHTLGALALCTLLSRDGWQVTFLGGDLPSAQAASMATRRQVPLVIAVCTLPGSAATLVAEHRSVPGITWGIAGPGAKTAEVGALAYLGARLGDVRAAVAGMRRGDT